MRSITVAVQGVFDVCGVAQGWRVGALWGGHCAGLLNFGLCPHGEGRGPQGLQSLGFFWFIRHFRGRPCLLYESFIALRMGGVKMGAIH